MWVYLKSEPNLWTVGHYSPNGTWNTDSDHANSEAAADRAAYLNGGGIRSQARCPCCGRMIEFTINAV